MASIKNATTTITLPAQQVLRTLGTGLAVVGGGLRPSSEYRLQGKSSVGPFPTDQTVSLTSTLDATLVYGIDSDAQETGPVESAWSYESGQDELPPADKQVMGNSGFDGNYPVLSRSTPAATKSQLSLLPKYKAALQLTAQRKKPTLILIAGDSTEAGMGVNTGTNGWVGARKMTATAQLARMLGAQDSAAVGSGCGNDVTLDQYDERVTLGTGITQTANVGALGGGWIIFGSGATGAYTITPRGSKGYDRVRVIYGRYVTGGASTMKVSVGGTQIGTFDARGGTGLGDTQSVEFSCTYSGPHVPIAIQGTSGTTDGTCIITAVIWYDSTDPGVILLNGGSAGAKASDLNSTGNPWAQKFAMAAIAPDLTICNCWINDTFYRTAPATYTTNLSAVKTNVASGDMVFVGYQPINDASMFDGQGDAIFAAMQSVAGTYPVIDLRGAFGQTYAAANAIGGIYSDTLHITAKGQYYKAAYIAGSVMP